MSFSPEPQSSPVVQEPTAQKDKRNLRIILAALVAVCIIGLPIAYFLAYFGGFNSGYSKGSFEFYYVKPNQRYGVDDLDLYVKSWTWAVSYKSGVFDCSEMSACLERDLENQGFHTAIVVGNSPTGSGRHAWLLVETSVGKYTPVEATNRQVVWSSSTYFDNYFKYDDKFETIQEALASNPTDFDWWNAT